MKEHVGIRIAPVWRYLEPYNEGLKSPKNNVVATAKYAKQLTHVFIVPTQHFLLWELWGTGAAGIYCPP